MSVRPCATPHGYRRALIRSGQISEDRSSILIVVGREDTGDLEAQIRGSRHAWDVRLISVDALIRLMALKEGTEDPRVHQQIRTILVPREFTKLDGIIDLVFSTAEDVRGEEPIDTGERPIAASSVTAQGPVDEADKGARKPKFTPVSFHAECIARIQVVLGRSLLRRSKATFTSPDGRLVLTCAVSREHEGANVLSYWFAFHPHQREALSAAAEAYVAFGCGSARDILLIPFSDFDRWVDGLWTTERDDRFYWHVRIRRREGRFILDRKAGHDPVDLTPYLLGEMPGSIAVG